MILDDHKRPQAESLGSMQTYYGAVQTYAASMQMFRSHKTGKKLL